MKTKMTLFFLAVFFGWGIQSVSAQDVKSGPQISVNTTTYDYGTIKYGANGNCEFLVTNTGNEPLIFSSVKGSCSCMVPGWPTEPIQPGKSAKISVKYDTLRTGPINKSVTVQCNAVNEPTKVLRIVGTVLPKEEVSPVSN